MKADTKVSLAIRHVGVKDFKTIVWNGTFAHCILAFAKFCGETRMAGRFDMCMGRSEEEARKGLRLKRQTSFPDEFGIAELERMMEQGDSQEEADERSIENVMLTESGE